MGLKDSARRMGKTVEYRPSSPLLDQVAPSLEAGY